MNMVDEVDSIPDTKKSVLDVLVINNIDDSVVPDEGVLDNSGIKDCGSNKETVVSLCEAGAMEYAKDKKNPILEVTENQVTENRRLHDRVGDSMLSKECGIQK